MIGSALTFAFLPVLRAVCSGRSGDSLDVARAGASSSYSSSSDDARTLRLAIVEVTVSTVVAVEY